MKSVSRWLCLVCVLVSTPALSDAIEDAEAALLSGASKNAEALFQAVLKEKPREARAYLGLATLAHQQGDIQRATEQVRKGLRYSRSRVDELNLHALAIRIEVSNGNFKAAKGHFREARNLRGGSKHQELKVAMARAYLREQAFQDAEELLREASSLPGRHKAEADLLLGRLATIKRAAQMSASPLVGADALTRGQAAGLLYQTGELPTLLGLASDPATENVIVMPGLRSFSSTGSADANFSRGELALLIEDVLYKAEGISRTRYIGSDSPYKDVKASNTAFNAMMTAASRGLMQPDREGNMHPDGSVSGAELIVTLGELEDILKKHAGKNN